eukprot:g30966.t1
MWEAGDFTAEEWTTIQTQLDTLKVFAQDSEKSGREWSLITLETLEFLASLPESVRERLAAQKLEAQWVSPFGPFFQAGQILGHAKSKPVLINFANEWDAGGGWLSGMWGAQEENCCAVFLKECLMRRSSLYLSLWPLRRPDDELWRRSPPNRGPSGTWIPDLDHKRPVAYRQLGFGEGGERVILPHLEERPGDDQTDLRGNEEAMKILKRVDVPRAYTNDKDGFPLSEAGVVYTPSLLVFRSPDTLSPDGKITGSKAYPPWTTSLLSVAALDLRPERGNQGAVYGYSVGSTSPSEPYLEVTREKMRSVLYAAVQGQYALGCGVFANSPEVIAMEWRKLLEPGGEFGNSFSVVVFAITFSTKNFRAFAEVFGELGPCIGDGSGKADHEAEFTAHLRA